MDRVKRIWYLSPMRAAKVQASLRIRAVSPEPSLLAHTSSESRETFRQKARSLAPLNGWACAVKICNDGMLEDTNSLDGAQMTFTMLTIRNYLIRSLFSWANDIRKNVQMKTIKCGKDMSKCANAKRRWVHDLWGVYVHPRVCKKVIWMTRPYMDAYMGTELVHIGPGFTVIDVQKPD